MGEVAGRLEVSSSQSGAGRAPRVWAECHLEGDKVVVRLKGWRSLLATRSSLRFDLASIVRVEHDPLARAHVRSSLRNWRHHGQGLWRLGVYHGFDGWSFWSIGLGRNAVLIECSGERFRYVVVEVADPGRTVREIRAAAAPPELPRARWPGNGLTGTAGAPGERCPPRAGRARQRGRMSQ